MKTHWTNQADTHPVSAKSIDGFVEFRDHD